MADDQRAKIISLNRERGSIKSSLTKLSSFIETNDSKNSIVYQTKLDNLLRIKQNLEQIKEEYFVTAEDSELQELEDSVEELEEECERLEVSLKKILASNKELLSASNCNSHSNEASSKTESISFRLPEIPLPKFSGHYQDWQSFKIQFENIIDNNDKLTENQKLYYLKSTLSGAAAEIVTIEETYASLKNALKERFDNKRLCVQSHFNDILALEIHASDSAKGLRAFLDNCIKHVRALKIMGLELNSFSEALLINILMKKLDRESRRQFELSLVSSNLPTWCEFIEFLEKRCLVLENIQASITAKSKPQQESYKKSHSFFVGNDSKKVCVACNKPLHPLFKCEAFLKLNLCLD
ncbi:hypothetical protein HNY73_018977 [Argiope bruennichi]|uniref:Uncharacterized protein n=1 Tax=Argiope bruennichi TaxID=94029 RepID=A0A8T0EFT9_ARGBR|nr:hypothetical protein HNY73_018977 [Argiope bruennichi]